MQKWMLWARDIAQWKGSWLACVKVWGALALKTKAEIRNTEARVKTGFKNPGSCFTTKWVEIEMEVSQAIDE